MFIAPDYFSLCEHVAGRIAGLVREKPDAVLGLATGSTPLGVYDVLVRLHQEDGLDFSGVTCFNLDEYYPMPPSSPQSYHDFMERHLFSRINCHRWLVPSGLPHSFEEITRSCLEYEAKISDAGGIDLQLLGIGRTGHIGFNEPGSAPSSRTRLVTLHPTTRQDAASAFGSLDQVPTQAVTLGIRTILEARALLLMAAGQPKAEAVQTLCTVEPSAAFPASWARTHPDFILCLDADAASLC